MGAAQTLAWPNSHMNVPTKSTVTKARPVLPSGALVVCSDILYALSLQSWSVGCQFAICTAARRGFKFSSLFAWPLGLNCGFSLTSACGPPTGSCSQGCPGAHESTLVRRGPGGSGGWGHESARHDREVVQRRSQQPLGSWEPLWGWVAWWSQQPQVQESRPRREPVLVSREAVASEWRERLQCGPVPCMSLNNGASLLWQSGFPPQAFPVADFLTPIPSVCLLTANSSPLTRFALQTPVPALSPHPHWQTHISGWGMQGCGMDHQYMSHSALPATDQLLHSPPIAPKVPLLFQLNFLPVRVVPLIQEPLLSFISLTRGTGLILLPFLFLFPSSFFHPTWLRGDLSGTLGV